MALPKGSSAYNSYELTVEKSKGWTGTLFNIPISTTNGQKLYYYIVERGSSSCTPIDYSTNGISFTQDGEEKTVTVLNQKEDVTSYTLPETGGEGTEGYLITGGALMLGAAMYYIIRKRKAAA